jgi:opacity protein-like surface antigen
MRAACLLVTALLLAGCAHARDCQLIADQKYAQETQRVEWENAYDTCRADFDKHKSDLPADAQDGETRARRWVGHDIQEIIRESGKPTIALPNGTVKTYEWRWGKPERFASKSEKSQQIWADRAVNNTAAGYVFKHATGWESECKEAYDVDAKGKVVSARADGNCPPDPSMILEGTASGTEGLGVGEL